MDREIRCPKRGSELPWRDYCDAHLARACIHIQLKNSDAALDDLSVVIDARANLPMRKAAAMQTLLDAYLERGTLWAERGETQLAINDFTAIIERNKCHFKALIQRAMAYQEAGEPDLAEQDFEQAKYFNPLNPVWTQRKFMGMAAPKAHPTLPDTRLRDTVEGMLSNPMRETSDA
jgi:tetratricopeptide (TPR) repeat protein